MKMSLQLYVSQFLNLGSFYHFHQYLSFVLTRNDLGGKVIHPFRNFLNLLV